MANSIRIAVDVVWGKTGVKRLGDKLAEPEANKQVLILKFFSWWNFDGKFSKEHILSAITRIIVT